MNRIEIIRTLVLTLLLGFSTIVASGIPVPDIPKGKGDSCVEPTDDMRKNHMKYILHQRDETMRKGIRTKTHSLKECINCHVVNDENNMPVVYKDERHFCNSCHEYASVQIDCFSCHTSVPDAKRSSSNSDSSNILNNKSAGFFNSATKSPVEN